jgi:hypothetical protein
MVRAYARRMGRTIVLNDPAAIPSTTNMHEATVAYRSAVAKSTVKASAKMPT